MGYPRGDQKIPGNFRKPPGDFLDLCHVMGLSLFEYKSYCEMVKQNFYNRSKEKIPRSYPMHLCILNIQEIVIDLSFPSPLREQIQKIRCVLVS